MFALDKSTDDAEFAITSERKQQMRFNQHFSETRLQRGKKEEGRGTDFYNPERQEEKPHQRKVSKMRQGRITKAQGDLKNRPMCHKTSVKKKTSSQDCCGGTFDSEVTARPCYFGRGHTCPPCAPTPRAIWRRTQPEFCPVSWRAFLGGTPLARMVKKENGGECVCWQEESLRVPVSLCQTSSHTQMSA